MKLALAIWMGGITLGFVAFHFIAEWLVLVGIGVGGIGGLIRLFYAENYSA